MFPSVRPPFSGTESPVTAEDLTSAVMEYLGAMDADDAGRILERYPILLDDEALLFLDGMIVVGRREDDDAMRSLLGNWERLRDQLDDAITDGIQAAVAGAQQRGERDAQIILEYFSLTSMEVRDFVERQRSILLDADLIERMRRGLSVVTEAESATQSEFLELRIEFLSDARTQGIEMAWNAFLWRVARWFAVHDTQPHGTGREE